MTFRDKLHSVTAPRGLGLCVGLDPDPNRLPKPFKPDTAGLSSFLKQVIQASQPYASAYKVNTAFYEAWGSKGWVLLEEIAAALPGKTLLIADAKRGDIGNTASRYAQAFFGALPFDAITLSPYMGQDSLQPFLENPEKGAFVLALTTNAGSRDFQYFSDGKEELYKRVLRFISGWAPEGNLGAVVGATHPAELQAIRSEFPSVPLLIPGVGAQGGDIEAVASLSSGEGSAPVLVNVSRGILYPKNNLAFPEGVFQACREYSAELKINRHKNCS